MPKYFSKYYPDASIDIVEIDPEMLNVARRFFHFKENDKMKVHIFDGRVFIKKFPKKYDIIFLDAYRNGTIPFHLATFEFIDEIKKRLAPDGVVVSNYPLKIQKSVFRFYGGNLSKGI